MNKKSFILSGFIITKFIMQYFFLNPLYDLHRDEYLYLDQANHLALGYLTVPPFTSWISCIIQFFGASIFWIKFFPALFGALTIFVVWKTIESLKGNLFALILGAIGVLFSALLRQDSIFTPSSFDVLSWTIFYFVFIKYFNSEKTKWLYFAAIVFAIGFLNKYNIVFSLLGLIPAVLLTEYRKIFIRKELYFALLLALVLISPNLLWQFNNHYPVIHHFKELNNSQLININRWNFFQDQLYYFLGSIPVIIASLYALLYYNPYKKYKVFLWIMFFTLAIFFFLKAKSYYTFGLYPIYIAFGAVFLGNILKTNLSKYIGAIILAIPLLTYFFMFKILFSLQSPNYIIDNEQTFKKTPLLRWEDGKDHILPQDISDRLGWKELAEKIDFILTKLPDKDETLILCDNYGQAGAINYYSINRKIKAISFNADYINWFNLDQKVVNFIRVKEFDISNDELEKTRPYFDTAFVADSITNHFAREYKTTIFVFSNPKIDVKQRLKAEIKKEKNYR